MMPWSGPDKSGVPFPSLGWSLLEWWADNLPSPRNSAEPLIFTDEQAMVLLRWYEVHPVTGRFLYRRGCSRRSKGSGKSPVEAVKDIAELAGDVVPDGWDAAGNPVGRPWGTGDLPDPWVQVAAVSEDQTDNTYSVLFSLLTDNDGRAADALGIDVGLTRCFLRGGRRGRLEPVTAAAGSREGQPVTYASLDETHLWLPSNGGKRLAATLRRNAGKIGGRTFETTNSFMPGEDSVAEGTHKAVESGQGIFYDAVEAPTEVDGIHVDADAPDEILRRALEVPYQGCWWVGLDRVVEEIRDPDTTWEDAQRFYFNWNRKGAGRAVDPKRWEELARPDRDLEPGERVGLGFDGSYSDDTTALIGCTADGFLFELAAWDRPPNDPGWRVPRTEVTAAVREAFGRFSVGRMLCDPPMWKTEIEGWAAEFGDDLVIAHDTNSKARQWPACDRFSTGIAEGSVTHDGNPQLSTHVLNMARKNVRVTVEDPDDKRTPYIFVKSGTGKIDRGIAAVLAYEAAMSMPEAEPEMAQPGVVFL